MTLTELKYIVAVARERHFGRAAEACFVSQPTLSVAIKKLEDELDVKIFERGSSEVSVTPLGEQIVRQAQQVIEQAAAIREIAKRGKDPVSGNGSARIAQSSSPVRSRSSNLTVKCSCSISGICGTRAMAWRTRSGSKYGPMV